MNRRRSRKRPILTKRELKQIRRGRLKVITRELPPVVIVPARLLFAKLCP